MSAVAPATPTGFVIAWRPVPAATPRRSVAWDLLADLAGARSGTVRVRNPCRRCGGPHGGVILDGTGLLASVTYAGGLAVAAVVSEAGAAGFGIDAEAVHVDDVSLAGVLGARRDAGVRAWTRVEAALKADGRGLHVDPAGVHVIEEGVRRWRAVIPRQPSEARGWDVAAPPHLIVSAALLPAPSA